MFDGFDKDIFADKVIKIRRTTYKDHPDKDEAFGLAFTDIANEYAIIGKYRGELKSEIGSILAKRPKKGRTNQSIPETNSDFSFTLLSRRFNVVEFISKDKITFKFGKIQNGSKIVLFSNSGAFQPSASQIQKANKFAKLCFNKEDRILYPPQVTLAQKDKAHIVLVVDQMYTVACTKSHHGNIVMKVMTSDGRCSQKKIDEKLLIAIKSLARNHFMQIDNLELPGM